MSRSAIADTTSFRFGSTWYLKFGRLNNAENMIGSRMPSCLMMSFDTRGVAVAVNAIMGTCGKLSRNMLRRLQAKLGCRLEGLHNSGTYDKGKDCFSAAGNKGIAEHEKGMQMMSTFVAKTHGFL